MGRGDEANEADEADEVPTSVTIVYVSTTHEPHFHS